MRQTNKELYELIKETRDMVHSIKENDLPKLKEAHIRLEEQLKFTNGKVKMHTKILWAVASAVGMYILMAILNNTFIIGG